MALTIGGSTLEVSVRPAGRRGVEGALAAACFAVSQGIGLDAVAAGLAAVDRAPGQLERVELVQPFDLWIEGSPDPSEWLPALRDIRRLTSERLICVLTVPDREPPRAGMLRACEAVADQILLTAEHPDRAPSEAALDEVLASFRRPGRVRVEPSRERAIEAALEIAEPGDSVLLTGGRRALRALDFRRPSRCDDRSLAARIIQRSQTVPRRRSA